MSQRARVAIIALALASIAAPPAAAEDTPPAWKHKPTQEELVAVWPRGAWNKGMGGRAVIKCLVALQGTVHDCRVVSDSPSGAGFGAAALALTPQFLMTPGMRDRQPIPDAPMTITIRWAELGAPVGSHLPGPPRDAPVQTRVLTNLTWEGAPSFAEMAAAYPSKGRELRIGGHVVLGCRLTGDGQLHSCFDVTEQPTGAGFLGAAKKLIDRFSAPRTFTDGQPLKDVVVHVPITFVPEMLDAGEHQIHKPKWTHFPDVNELAAAYPKAARAANITSGRVVLSCSVRAEGRLGDCAVDSQEPSGMGFDQTALALAPQFQVVVWTEDGLPTVGGRLRMPVRYVMPGSDATASTVPTAGTPKP
ncbi:MAG TPA: energy transducer TonB [Caulobacteraceae bacterium]|nr:energy transducer TonB [Caulobacteraceae bacterium]